MNKLEQLKKYTTIVADTGDINSVKNYSPQDATTNPSLILKAAQMPQYQHLIDDAIAWATRQHSDPIKMINYAIEKLMVNFGSEILKIIPGRISTEVDAHLSFDENGTIKAAERIIELYDQQGIPSNRVLIKIASTWEGINAARQLEAKKINCNMTLLFNLEQAILCADAGVTLISPFVGRIYDWYKQNEQRDYLPENDPGVLSVKAIFNYYKSLHYQTIIMGASFRHAGQVEALSGCDYLTLSPSLMEELQTSTEPLTRQLDPNNIDPQKKVTLDEKTFRWTLNHNPMACEKLADGIRIFAHDMQKLKHLLLRQANKQS